MTYIPPAANAATAIESAGKPYYVFMLTLVATLGGLLFGYDTAVISGAVESLRAFFLLEKTFGVNADYYHGIMVASALIGCIMGSMVSGFFAAALGRKKTLLIASLLFIVASVGAAYPHLIFFAKNDNSFGVLCAFNVYRIIGGVGVGLASALCPMYIAEIAPASIRGKLISWNQFAIIFGMLVVYFVNYSIVKEESQQWIDSEGWRMMFLSNAYPAILFFALLFFVPETPRYLTLIGKEKEAFAVLSKINGSDIAQKIVDEIKATSHERTEKVTAYGYKVLVIGILLSVFQQIIGINIVLYYAPTIFKSLGAGNDSAMYQTVIMGLVNLLFTLVTIFTVDKFGRKPLLIIGSFGMTLGMFALGWSAYSETTGGTKLFFTILYSASFMMSWGPICWVLIAEIFPNTIRSQAIAIAVAAQWFFNFIVTATFPALKAFSLPFTFCFYGSMGILAIIFVWKMVPETKGKTLEGMAKLWRK